MVRDEFIPLSVPNLNGNELKYVTAAVESEWVSTSGPYVNEFETKLAEYVHSKGAVSCQNGTSGLHIALLIAGVSKEDIVLVPTLTFIASVNPISYIGAEPVFMDCDDSLCIDILKIQSFCENECDFVEGTLYDKKKKRPVKAIMVVHVFGNMADMESIMEIAGKYNLIVIEDAAEALGTYYTEGVYKGKFAGTIGDIGVYSFNGNKIITTGGGGMIVSKHEKYLKKAKHLTTQAKTDELNYIHDEIGYNYRITNLQAALGLAQLEKLESFISIKKKNYIHYRKRIEEIRGLSLLAFRENIRSNYWFYALFCDGYNLDRDEIIQKLIENKVQSRPVWGLIHEQLPYKNCREYHIKNAKKYWRQIVNIPCSTNLLSKEIDFVMDILEKYK